MAFERGTGSAAADAAVDGGLRARVSDGWVYVAEDAARSHPLFGVYGWALLLLGALAIGPIVLIWQDVSILVSIYGRPGEIWAILAADAVVLVFAWGALYSLATEHPSFQARFYRAALLGFCSGLLFFAVMWTGLPPAYEHVAWWGVIMRCVTPVVFAVYVVRSDRINVSTQCRVRPDDPWLLAQWDGGRHEATAGGPLAGFMRRLGLAAGATPRPEAEAGPEPVPEDSHAYVIDPYYTAGGGIEPKHLVQPRADAHRGEPTIWEVEPEAPPDDHWGDDGPLEAAEPPPRAPEPPAPAPAAHGDEPPEEEPALKGDEATLERLRRLQRARDEGLISDAEYQMKRSRIVADL